jgi:hypothetical protein
VGPTMDPFLHKCGCNCHTRMVRFPWPNLPFMLLHTLVLVLHPPQKSECPPFWNCWSYKIKSYDFMVTFNAMTSFLNFIKVCQFVQNLLVWDTKTDSKLVSWASLSFFRKVADVLCNYVCMYLFTANGPKSGGRIT